MSQFNLLSIQNIRKETEDAVIITFKLPSELAKNYIFKAGQYLTLRTTIKGDEVRRDYSICSTPQSDTLQVGIKKVEGGLFSAFANSKLSQGDCLEVSPPNGKFIYVPNAKAHRHFMVFAAGSGITPVFSIIKSVLTQEPNSSITLVYGNKSPDKTLFYEELHQLKEAYDKRFRLHFIFSQTQEPEALFGRIDNSIVNYLLNKIDKGLAIDKYYICGPEAMTQTVIKTLENRGVDNANILFELFTASAKSSSKEVPVNVEQSKVTVILDDETSSFVMSSKKTILEAALKNNLDAPYSCKGGVCCSCLARLKVGTVFMRQNNILTDSELEEGLILSCQSQPTSASIVVDYDDV